MVGLQSKAIRTVLRWQILLTLALAAIAWQVAGPHGALSAALGGLVSFIAGVAFAVMASMGRADSAGSVLMGALRAEGIKIVVIVLLLGIVATVYDDIVMVAFIGTFIAATLVFSAAAFVRED
ncbi:MAG: ATP synthase subunit I [Gammaproteobacteria bacterium]|nr:ATP synthase subunit I [Gammaproteobacteria bacterium]